ncbi:thiamine-phosphate kinase [Aestuariicella hydrocarbonica]|uniref:Thiamine-monophosphate kinase n=1 Tax=Pseudomaricurvus hydrocarbonicus TaxID=1470433 RepID=A0A9E5MPX4_9GAMM|nr:thiamine-phosphate kinase [Aestuariicella hydrocarbonica]
MSLGEFELIKQYFQQQSGAPGVALGIGDDCALLTVPLGQQLAVSMDTSIADVHFPADGEPDLIAERALRVNISDLAAMGAEPLWFTLGLTLPDADPQWLQAFSQGLFRVAREYGIALVGGDTTRGKLSITIQVHGAVAEGKALLRSRASEGDQIFVTGPVGDGAAALAVMKQQLSAASMMTDYLMERYYRPQPQVVAGQLLTNFCAAAIDISDGLVADLGHICEQSGVGADLHLERIPLSEAVRQLVSFEQGIDWALSGGDDYQLCFTVPKAQVQQLETLVSTGKIVAHHIGEITAGNGVSCWHNSNPVVPSGKGFQHFGGQEALS